MPPAIDAWNAASERPATHRGAESWTPMLNKATASIQTAPATTKRCRRQHRLTAQRDRRDGAAHRQSAGADRGFAAHALAHLGDVERADHPRPCRRRRA